MADTKHSPVNTLHNPGTAPAAHKQDRLAEYNAHRRAFWGSTAELFVWNADSYPGTELEKATHVWRQVRAIVGILEQA